MKAYRRHTTFEEIWHRQHGTIGPMVQPDTASTKPKSSEIVCWNSQTGVRGTSDAFKIILNDENVILFLRYNRWKNGARPLRVFSPDGARYIPSC